MTDLFRDLLPGEVAAWASTHVRRVEYRDDMPTAMISLDAQHGYCLTLGADFWGRLTRAEQTAVLMHELAHVVRGDNLVMREIVDRDGPAAATDWNDAADLEIHSYWISARHVEAIRSATARIGGSPLVWEQWAATHGIESPLPWRAPRIYEMLRDAAAQQSQAPAQEACDPPPCDDAREASGHDSSQGSEQQGPSAQQSSPPQEQSHTSQTNQRGQSQSGQRQSDQPAPSADTSRRNAPPPPQRGQSGGQSQSQPQSPRQSGTPRTQDGPTESSQPRGDQRSPQGQSHRASQSAPRPWTGDVQPATGDYQQARDHWVRAYADAPYSMRSAGMGGSRRLPTVVPPREAPRVVAVLRELLAQCATSGATRIMGRTWRRPNRQDLERRGHGMVRTASVCVAVDVSGSLAGHTRQLLGIARGMREELHVETVIWADRAAHVHEGGRMPDVGCGTQIRPAMALLRRLDPDIAIVLTDGLFADHLARCHLPPCPIIWVMVGADASRSQIPQRGSDRVIGIEGAGT